MLKQEFDKYQRDGVRISMWIPYALRLSEGKGRRGEQRGEYFKKDRGKTECTMELSERRKWGLALQKEYAWRGESCSKNNTVVKSSSPRAPCRAHLDLLAGIPAPVFVIFPFHFFPFAMALQASLSSSSLSEDLSLSIHFLYGSSFPFTPVMWILCLLTSCGSTKSPFIFSLFLPGSLHSFSSSCFNDYSGLWPLVNIQKGDKSPRSGPSWALVQPNQWCCNNLTSTASSNKHWNITEVKTHFYHQPWCVTTQRWRPSRRHFRENLKGLKNQTEVWVHLTVN